MNITQTTITEFATGNGTADATPSPIIEAGYASKAYKGVTVRATSGTVYVGPRGVTTDNGFKLTAGEELFIPVQDPSNVYVVGDGNYAWLST